ncbi:putative oxidoreductase [[Actinomadura] parvosata subsp. kistnae]|uniref:Alcohol dehydrogenase n=1 Tax=[Actinomadura] parvosata subsp. kistnae TaxID=1909395 RepID=A0A1U9ZRQ9_9ACTN|nr:aldo/keto reductase [Nonomuraea sp. ATCC 55076]AQZ60628.1 alcohol dehydrogenase [Nonomuraea sp. ATCC 55076]SPL90783.1 putative oxidoreductase [Actinomadura parvosata subsp. kistnae]
MPVLGSSGLPIFPLALGTNTFRWTASAEESHRILDAFVAGGGTFLDTADVYSIWAPGSSGGDAETVIGEWLAAGADRDKVTIATKVSSHPAYPGLKAGNVAAAIEQSLKRLRTDYVDVYYAHADDPGTPLEETVAAFDDLVRRGLVRHVGLSNYDAARVQEWIDIARATGAALPVTLQPHYNLLHRADFERRLRPVAERNDLGVVPYQGLAGGFLTGKYLSAADAQDAQRGPMLGGYLTEPGFAVARELRAVADELGTSPATVALAWLRAQPTVVAPIASVSTAGQLDALLASATLDLSPDQLARLTAASDRYAATRAAA